MSRDMFHGRENEWNISLTDPFSPQVSKHVQRVHREEEIVSHDCSTLPFDSYFQSKYSFHSVTWSQSVSSEPCQCYATVHCELTWWPTNTGNHCFYYTLSCECHSNGSLMNKILVHKRWSTELNSLILKIDFLSFFWRRKRTSEEKK